MNPDDQSQLSAYLDGELDPDRRVAIESALMSNPALSDRLRELASVRDLVSGLPRPAPPIDFGPAVLARLHRRRRGLRVPAVGPRGLAWFGVAATILIALSIGLSSRRGPVVAVGEPAAKLPAVEATPDEPGARAEEDVIPSPSRVEIATGPDLSKARDDVADRAREIQRGQVREMLNDPALSRLIVVTDVMPGPAEDRVDQLIRDTPRASPAYGRITIGQGIVIDPKHPNRATVFAVAMDERELRSLKAKLRETFPGSVEDADADPVVVAQLARVDQMAIRPGKPAVALEAPDVATPRLALRSPYESGASEPAPHVDDLEHLVRAQMADLATPGASDDPMPRAAASTASNRSPAEDADREAERTEGRRQAGEDRDRARRGRSSIVLVWMTAREP